jgi:hypothetical protein
MHRSPVVLMHRSLRLKGGANASQLGGANASLISWVFPPILWITQEGVPMWRVVLRKDLVAVAGGQFDYNFGLGNGCR